MSAVYSHSAPHRCPQTRLLEKRFLYHLASSLTAPGTTVAVEDITRISNLLDSPLAFQSFSQMRGHYPFFNVNHNHRYQSSQTPVINDFHLTTPSLPGFINKRSTRGSAITPANKLNHTQTSTMNQPISNPPYHHQNSTPLVVGARRPLRSSPLAGPAVSSDGTVASENTSDRPKPSRISSTPEFQTLGTLPYHPSSMPSPPTPEPLILPRSGSHGRKERKKSLSTSSFSTFASPTVPPASRQSPRDSSRPLPPSSLSNIHDHPHYPRAHLRSPPSSPRNQTEGSDWMVSNTYAVTPKFTRLSMSPGVVMPVSAKDHHRAKSQPLLHSPTLSRSKLLHNSKSSSSLRSTVQTQMQTQERVHARSPSAGSSSFSAKPSTVSRPLHLSKSTSSLGLVSAFHGHSSSASMGADEGRIGFTSLKTLKSKCKPPESLRASSSSLSSPSATSLAHVNASLPATDRLEMAGTHRMESSIVLGPREGGVMSRIGSSTAAAHPEFPAPSLLCTASDESANSIHAASLYTDVTDQAVQAHAEVRSSTHNPSSISCESTSASSSISSLPCFTSATSISIGSTSSSEENLEKVRLRNDLDAVNKSCHPSATSASSISPFLSSTRPPSFFGSTPSFSSVRSRSGSLASQGLSLDSVVEEPDKAAPTTAAMGQLHLDADAKISSATANTNTESISVADFFLPQLESQSQSWTQTDSQSQPLQHKPSLSTLSITSITNETDANANLSKSRKSSLGSLSLSFITKKVMLKAKSLSSLKSGSHSRTNSDADSGVLGVHGHATASIQGSRPTAKPDTTLVERKKHHKGKGLSFLSFGSTAEAQAIAAGDTEEVPPVPEIPASVQQLFPHDLLSPSPSPMPSSSVHSDGQETGREDAESELERDDVSDEDFMAAEKLLEDVMSFNQPATPSRRRSNLTLSPIDVDTTSITTRRSRTDVDVASISKHSRIEAETLDVNQASLINEEDASEAQGPPWRPSSPPCQTMDNHAAALGKRASTMSSYSHLSNSVRSLPGHPLDHHVTSFPRRDSVISSYSHLSTSVRSLPSQSLDYQHNRDIPYPSQPSTYPTPSRPKRASVLSSFSHISNSVKSSLHGVPSTSQSLYHASISRPTSLMYTSESSIASSSPPPTPSTPGILVPPFPTRARSRAGKPDKAMSLIGFDVSQDGLAAPGNGIDLLVHSFPGDLSPGPTTPIPSVSALYPHSTPTGGRDRTSKAMKLLGILETEKMETDQSPVETAVSKSVVNMSSAGASAINLGAKSNSPKSSLDSSRHSVLGIGVMRRSSLLGLGARSQSPSGSSANQKGGSVRKFWRSLTGGSSGNDGGQ
ncbi:hypothetical protein VKT23_013434 [Stygiomarasmius scandens]|uniref:HSF-type DNA-binding domain-containing protein n=1 Tax=Marasmiellus scandens TaxID=2682957 RepID=A0ABR1J3E8_9AGAR